MAPSGRLATTFPVKWDDVPSSAGFPGKVLEGPDPNATGFRAGQARAAEVTYDDDIWVGYRHFATKGVKTAYPFGFGLSYTSFQYAGLRLGGKDFEREVTASVKVTNTGKIAGREVVQLYLSAPGKSLPKPALELKGFAKTKLLKPGESQTVSFTLQTRDLASFDAASSSWVAEAGSYTVKVGASSEDIRQTASFLKAKEEKVATRLDLRRPVKAATRSGRREPGGSSPALAARTLPPASQPDPFVARPRVVVMTDIANEPDDQMSMVRFLLYSNGWDVEGLVASTSTWMKNRIRPDVIQSLIDAYEQVQPNLLKHAAGFPTAASLRAVVAAGQPAYGMDAVGSGKSSAGSALILQAASKSDPRPLWVLAWGGTNTLAQALTDARATRTPRELEAIVAKLRVYTISDQDDAGPWIRREFPALHYIAIPSTQDGEEYAYATWTGISGDRFYKNAPGADFTTFSDEWVNANVRARARSASSTRSRAASTRATRRRSWA